MKLDVTVRIPPDLLTALETRARLERVPVSTWLIRAGLRDAWKVVHNLEQYWTNQSSADAATEAGIELGLTPEEFNALQEAVRATYHSHGNELARVSIAAFIEGAAQRELQRAVERAGSHQ
jgi:hypothetical protein